MNNGFFGFPNRNVNNKYSISEFNTSGTYIIPFSAKKLWIMAIGGGGGGGGGGRRAAGTASFGGGGGGGGTIVIHDFLVDTLGGPNTTLLITIGSGGTGGPAGASNTTSGTVGSVGGHTTLSILGSPGFFIAASGGNSGSGGSGTSGNGASGKNNWMFGFFTAAVATHGAGASSSSSAQAGSQVVYYLNHTGGAAGGGINNGTPGTGFQGGAITGGGQFSGVRNPLYTLSSNICQPGQVDTGLPGDSATGKTIFGQYSPGLGGAGGGAGPDTLASGAGAGGAGYRGGGGGGGGGSRNGVAAGAGGRGGDGYVVIVAY
jgi:hypothetical protein